MRTIPETIPVSTVRTNGRGWYRRMIFLLVVVTGVLSTTMGGRRRSVGSIPV